MDTAKGTITAKSTKRDQAAIDWAWLLEDHGLDPSVFRVLDDQVEVRSWDTNLGDGETERLYYYRAKIVRAGQGLLDDTGELEKWILKRPARKQPAGDTDPVSLVVCLSDWQIGKADGDGLQGTVERVKRLEEDVIARAGELKRLGVNVSQLTVLGLGDLLEGCEGWYAMQPFQVEADQRTQRRITYRLLVSLLDAWVNLAPEMLVACVPGNHGENRRAGKAFTTFGDNDDVSVFETARDVVSRNLDRFGHVRWLIPDDELTVSMDVCGTAVGLAHGHQVRPGRFPHTKVWDWWEKQAMGRRPVGDCDVLVSGHFHHWSVLDQGGRLALQCPPLDGGSQWFEEQAGYPSTAGTLTFVTGDGRVDHIRVL